MMAGPARSGIAIMLRLWFVLRVATPGAQLAGALADVYRASLHHTCRISYILYDATYGDEDGREDDEDVTCHMSHVTCHIGGR